MIEGHAILSILIFAGTFLNQQHGSLGYLLDPPSRGTLWKRGYYTHLDYHSTDEPVCGGHLHQELHFTGEKFRGGYPYRSYLQGERATFELDETHLDAGYFDFKICPIDTIKDAETQNCFNNHPVILADGSDRYYVRKDVDIAHIDVQIPPNIECNFCVLQYHFHPAVEHVHTQPVIDDDFYGCCDIKILGKDHASEVVGPSIQGLIIKGPGNFGNIFGENSVIHGNANAWTQTNNNVNNLVDSTLGSVLGSSRLTGSVTGPSISGAVIRGPANFGNVFKDGSVIRGNANAWTQTNNNVGNRPNGYVTVNGGGRIQGPSLSGAVISGPANFGNIHGPGSTIHGNSNAWTQTNNNVGGGLLGGGGVVVGPSISGAVIGSGSSSRALSQNFNSWTQSSTSVKSSGSLGNFELGGVRGPSITGLKISGAANFGNIHGPGSVIHGNSNAWTQTNTNVGGLLPHLHHHAHAHDHVFPLPILPSGGGVVGPSIKGIIIKGPANFGNIHGPGSLQHGNSNAWTQDNNRVGVHLKRDLEGDVKEKEK